MSEKQTIKLKNSYFERLIAVGPNGQAVLSKSFNDLMTKRVFPGEFKPGYWLGRVFDKILQEMNYYLREKQKLIDEYTRKYEKDGQEMKDGKVVKKWKKGDPMLSDKGQPSWTDFNAYMEKFNELQEIEVDVGIWPIAFDPEKGPDAVGQEMLLLVPLLKEPNEGGKVVPLKRR